MDRQNRPAPSGDARTAAPSSHPPKHAAPASPKRRAAEKKHAAPPPVRVRPARKSRAATVGSALSRFFKDTGSFLSRFFKNAVSAIGPFFKNAAHAAGPFFKKALGAIGRFFKNAGRALGRLPGDLPGALSRLLPYLAGGMALIVILVAMYAMMPGPEDLVAAVPASAPVAAATEQPVSTPEPAATVSPTAEPEAAATPEPTVEPAEEPSAGSAKASGPVMSSKYKTLKGIPNTDRALGLPKCEMVDHSYFNDTVFIGDSVSEKLHLYVTKMRKTYPELLGNAKFITTPSLSSRNALKPVSQTSLHPTIRGKKMTIEDAVALSGAKKVYVMLGMNDVGINGPSESAKNLMTLLRKIKDKSPDIQIFVQSATPRMKGEKPNNEQLFKYNLKVYEYCLKYEEYDMYFVDVAYVMRNKYGNLTAKYCSDPDSMAIHFTDKACKEWIKFLYTHALVG